MDFSFPFLEFEWKRKTDILDSPDKKVVQLAMAMLISNGRSRLRSKVGSVVQHYQVDRQRVMGKDSLHHLLASFCSF